jgi:hypothetical protein
VLLFLIPKDTPLVVTVNLASVPAGEFAFWFGKRNRIADGVPVWDAKKVLAKLPPDADFRQTLAILWTIGLWVAVVALAYGGATLWQRLMR